MEDRGTKGGVTKQLTVWCHECEEWEQQDVDTRRLLERIIRANGWTLRRGKWHCPTCSASPAREPLTLFQSRLLAILDEFGPLSAYALGLYLWPDKPMKHNTNGGPNSHAVAATWQAGRAIRAGLPVEKFETRHDGVQFATSGDFVAYAGTWPASEKRAFIESKAMLRERFGDKRPEQPTFEHGRGSAGIITESVNDSRERSTGAMNRMGEDV